ncbi:MAG TPA: 16S rRNA (guanine(527)-N(7))-methyltransferase RsmG [Bacteroidales bacterium]|nr:16S rRNA (guanine(527)-N(7))-methyltransferase RsmG [Bacteroidales bacterium]HRZ49569.1 16S rRNA (guanine(527)-N(7))-methyltransferase RsmG [Bacteroidales bacterium]
MNLSTHFPNLTPEQLERLDALEGLYAEWNSRINVISRKDMEHFAERHLLHSLSLGMFFSFSPGTTVLDVGTGGGFPGIPLAILFPEVQFTLVDSVAKKIRVVQEVQAALHLSNVTAEVTRVEQMRRSFDFVVSRAVTALPAFIKLAGNRVAPGGCNTFPNGILYLKGGAFEEELLQIRGWRSGVFSLSEKLPEPFFETKKLVYLYR